MSLAPIQQLTTRLRRIEVEIQAIRRELNTLPQQQNLPVEKISYRWANKTAIQEETQKLLHTLSIHGNPIGPKLLQKQMREAQLSSNELSQSIIEMREE